MHVEAAFASNILHFILCYVRISLTNFRVLEFSSRNLTKLFSNNYKLRCSSDIILICKFLDWTVVFHWKKSFCDIDSWRKILELKIVNIHIQVQRVNLTCDVIKKLAPFALSKLWILVADRSMRWSHDTFLKKLRLYTVL